MSSRVNEVNGENLQDPPNQKSWLRQWLELVCGGLGCSSENGVAVFSWRRKVVVDLGSFSSVGSVFHARGAACRRFVDVFAARRGRQTRSSRHYSAVHCRSAITSSTEVSRSACLYSSVGRILQQIGFNPGVKEWAGELWMVRMANQ